uniref:Uncharacterized protein n=1 Tax=Anopheles coluzzii TaxID=1518534 RepID=A0A8W7PB19_ANOCL
MGLRGPHINTNHTTDVRDAVSVSELTTVVPSTFPASPAILTTGSSFAPVRRGATFASAVQRSATTTAAVQRSTTATSAVQRSATVASAVKRSATTTAAVQRSATGTAAVQRSATGTAAVQRSAIVASAMKRSATSTAAVQRSTTATAAVQRSATVASAVQRNAIVETPIRRASAVASPVRYDNQPVPAVSPVPSTSKNRSGVIRRSKAASPLRSTATHLGTASNRADPVSTPPRATVTATDYPGVDPSTDVRQQISHLFQYVKRRFDDIENTLQAHSATLNKEIPVIRKTVLTTEVVVNRIRAAVCADKEGCARSLPDEFTLQPIRSKDELDNMERKLADKEYMRHCVSWLKCEHAFLRTKKPKKKTKNIT